jgi:hypothetical protein
MRLPWRRGRPCAASPRGVHAVMSGPGFPSAALRTKRRRGFPRGRSERTSAHRHAPTGADGPPPGRARARPRVSAGLPGFRSPSKPSKPAPAGFPHRGVPSPSCHRRRHCYLLRQLPPTQRKLKRIRTLGHCGRPAWKSVAAPWRRSPPPIGPPVGKPNTRKIKDLRTGAHPSPGWHDACNPFGLEPIWYGISERTWARSIAESVPEIRRP